MILRLSVNNFKQRFFLSSFHRTKTFIVDQVQKNICYVMVFIPFYVNKSVDMLALKG